MDIAGMLTQQLSGSAIQQISAQLGADSATTQSAVTAALPLLLGAIGHNAANPSTSTGLVNALQDHKGNVLQDVAGYLASGGNTQDGNGIVGHLLGDQSGAAATAVSTVSGLNANSSGQLLAMLAPLVMGAIGKAHNEQGLDANSLASLLGGQQQQANSMLGGLATQLLDSNHDGSVVDDVMNLGSNLLGGLFGKK
ncbi:MAG: DUF937 domain-containing protein [Chloroflexi bacterium]|nr:DUF937 domain-containing protein [Chloroflexota bacterium]